MSVKLAAVTIDCDDPVVVARFWSAALERPVDAGASSEFASIGMPEHRDTVGWAITDGDHPTWLFAKVPEPKRAKNRMHVDLAAADHEAEVDAPGRARRDTVADMDEWGYRWTVLQDPEGNEFCVAQLR